MGAPGPPGVLGLIVSTKTNGDLVCQALTLPTCLAKQRFSSSCEQHDCLYGGGVTSGERGGFLVDWEVEEGKPFPSNRKQIRSLLLMSFFFMITCPFDNICQGISSKMQHSFHTRMSLKAGPVSSDLRDTQFLFTGESEGKNSLSPG